MEEFVYGVSPADKKKLDEYYDAHPEFERPNYEAFNIIESDKIVDYEK